MDDKKLPRTKQCAKCPWKVTTNPLDIPDGYDVEKHKKLVCTIANPGDLRTNKNAIACHHSNGNDKMFCVGWLHNQLGVGNNIPLRIQMMQYKNAKDITVFGNQHGNFHDTLPK